MTELPPDVDTTPDVDDLPEAQDDAQVPGPLAQPREPIDEAGDLPAG